MADNPIPTPSEEPKTEKTKKVKEPEVVDLTKEFSKIDAPGLVPTRSLKRTFDPGEHNLVAAQFVATGLSNPGDFAPVKEALMKQGIAIGEVAVSQDKAHPGVVFELFHVKDPNRAQEAAPWLTSGIYSTYKRRARAVVKRALGGKMEKLTGDSRFTAFGKPVPAPPKREKAEKTKAPSKGKTKGAAEKPTA